MEEPVQLYIFWASFNWKFCRSVLFRTYAKTTRRHNFMWRSQFNYATSEPVLTENPAEVCGFKHTLKAPDVVILGGGASSIMHLLGSILNCYVHMYVHMCICTCIICTCICTEFLCICTCTCAYARAMCTCINMHKVLCICTQFCAYRWYHLNSPPPTNSPPLF